MELSVRELLAVRRVVWWSRCRGEKVRRGVGSWRMGGRRRARL
jgi:hypothetical protein